ncbi:protein of unknown function DUF58 [Haloterrigena turkmenica DSM 5511]|uniref:DUF58 domain-containing protein n=1 Tax=Haloterrigena turkmenica (strain ATCC 51198 / DSM 5511 / JCM 9101 / NCIMB 13204 / VKM B-1734 / 4k) TaxID=543526 RepID=D2RP66_HALTV|nr:DUF58 domain-containing protein [Haloterrigena turkmenica]ADB60100.1 protein of unknown function DUF58 [Haloterrigena turkmenica DSM 5511]
MKPTRRLWAVASLAAFLAGVAVVTARPLLLGGAGLVGSWIVARQYRFYRALEETVDALAVEQSAVRAGVRTGDTVPVTLSARLASPSPLAVAIEAGLPTTAVADESFSLSLDPSTSATTRTVDVSWPVAGRHRFDEPTVTATDGFLRETVSLGTTSTVTVEPRGPRTIHVGEGGDRITMAYGEHEAGRLGSGIEPAELREYMPGDTADRIDWKATARLATPHVREYEAETDRRTLLVVDHRGSLATGRPDETELDYLRDVALATAASARRLGDPVGLRTVGDEGITFRLDPTATPVAYDRIRRRLLDLEPTVDPTTLDGSGREGRRRRTPTPRGGGFTAADARAKRIGLGDDDDPFASTLRPFYAAREGYRERIESDPLYGAVKRAHSGNTEGLWTILFTDDSRPAELRETVKLARGNGNSVLVLLAPTVLYESDGLADVEDAYDRYVEFENLRRDLARMPRVTALEVGPRDRLSTILSDGRAARGERA